MLTCRITSRIVRGCPSKLGLGGIYLWLTRFRSDAARITINKTSVVNLWAESRKPVFEIILGDPRRRATRVRKGRRICPRRSHPKEYSANVRAGCFLWDWSRNYHSVRRLRSREDNASGF